MSAEGELRRPPPLWEQRLARTTGLLGVGISSSGDATSLVTNPSPPPGDGGGVEPAPVLPPPGDFIKPSTPTLVGSVQGIRVRWDGLNSAGDLWPYDTSWIEVHMSTAGTGFTVGTATLKGRLDYPGEFFAGGLTAGTTYYFRLRGADPADNYTDPSDAASGQTGLTTSGDYGTATIGSGAVSFNARQIGGVTNTVGAVAPSNPLLNDIWLDSSPGTAIVHRIWNGSTWVANAWGSASIAAGQVTALQIAAGAITAGAIVAGEITGDKLDVDAINGMTITGATIRTATGTGARVVLDTAGIRGFDGTNTERFNLNASTGDATVTGRVRTRVSGARLEVNNDATFSDSVVWYGAGGAAAIVLQNVAGNLVVSGQTQFQNAVSASGFSTTGDVGGASATITGLVSGGQINISGANADFPGAVGNAGATTGDAGFNGNRLRQKSSTQRLKYDIAAVDGEFAPEVDEARTCDVVTVDPRDLLDVAVAEFSWLEQEEPMPWRELGFIAEDVAAKFPIAASIGPDGQPIAVRDTPILAALLAVVREQQATITDLRTRIEALEA